MIDSSGRNPRKTNKHSRVWRLRYYDPSGRLLTPRPSTMTSAIFLDDGSLSLLFYMAGTGGSATTECPRLLGLGSGSIQDWQIASSSHWTGVGELPEFSGASSSGAITATTSCQPKYARLYQSGSKAWCAKHRSVGEWILVDLGVISQVGKCHSKAQFSF